MESINEFLSDENKKFVKNKSKIYSLIPSKNEIEMQELFTALSNKDTLYDHSEDKIIAVINKNTAKVVDKKIIEKVVKTAEDFFEKIKQHGENRKGQDDEYSRVSEVLITMEFLNAANIKSPHFKTLKKDLNNYLKRELKEASPERKRLINREIMIFLSMSKASINSDIYKVKNHKFTNQSEKETIRKEFIIDMMKNGVVDFDFLDSVGFIDELSVEEVEFFLKNCPAISNDEYEIAALKSGEIRNRKELLERYLDTDRKFLLNYATPEEIARLVVDGKISMKEGYKKINVFEIPNFDKDLILELYSLDKIPKKASFIMPSQDGNKMKISNLVESRLPGDKLLALLSDENVKYANSLSSNELVKMYGKISLDEIMQLEKMGYVNSKDVIKVLNLKSLKSISPNEYEENRIKIKEFYDLSKLEKILKENDNTLPENFICDFNSMFDEMSDEENQKYFSTMFEELKDREKNESDDLLVKLVSSKIKVRPNMEYKVNNEYIEDNFLEENLSFDQILLLYNLGYVNVEFIKEMFSDEEIKEIYEKGQIGIEALVLISDKDDYLMKLLNDKKVSLQDIVELYSSTEFLDVESLKKIISEQSLSEVSVAEMLLDTISKEKIKDLFLNYIISHDDISNLVSREMITQEDADKYAKKLTDHKKFMELIEDGKGIIKLLPDINPKEKRIGIKKETKINPRSRQLKIDPVFKTELLKEVGFKENERLYLQGIDNSLSGYTVCPSEELGIMVFINAEEPQNATYIMSMEQGMHWIYNINRENKIKKLGITEKVVSEATKEKLRETEHVKVRNDSAGWGKNMVDAMKKLSPEFESRLKSKGKEDKYNSSINEIIEEIKADYEIRKDGER